MQPEISHSGNRKALALGALPILGFTGWAIYHLAATASAFTGHGSPLALTWTISFLLLWWVPVSWLERPHTGHAEAWHPRPIVTVAIPAYNEEPRLLRACLQSLLDQTRRPDRVHIVDDGSDPAQADYTSVKDWWLGAAEEAAIATTWERTVNRGKRHAQMHALADDDGDVYVTLDSDSVLERRAIEEGIKPLSDPRVHSVAGMVVVWNARANWLTFLTCMLYTPFTRGFRSAQSVIGRVMVNSGTLAFYRGATVRQYAGSYENETFRGRPMQMNDDSMLTMYALLAGRAVHQPTSVAFTIVPEKFGHYARQQLRWMRGTFVRTFWWVRYFRLNDPAFWMPLGELAQTFLSVAIIAAVLITKPHVQGYVPLLLSAALVGVGINYLIALRYFVIRRNDEPWWVPVAVVASAPLAGVWRFLVLRPMMFYAMATCWRISSWGTRGNVEAAG